MKRIAAVFLTAAMLMSLSACTYGEYKAALKLYEEEKYQEAKEAFEAIADYKDSALYIKNCSYNFAKEIMKSGSFDSAASILEELGNFEDCAELLTECRYAIAEKTFDSGDYKAAADAFAALGEYKDSAERKEASEDEMIRNLLIGNWISDGVEYGSLFNESIVESLGLNGSGEYADYFKFDGISTTFDIVFTERDTFQIAINRESIEEMADKIIAACTEGTVKMLENEITMLAEEKGLTVEELYEIYGVENMEELAETFFEGSIAEFYEESMGRLFDEISESTNENGTYRVEHGEIKLFYGTQEEKGYFSISDDTFTLTGEGNEAGESAVQALYPITFRRTE